MNNEIRYDLLHQLWEFLTLASDNRSFKKKFDLHRWINIKNPRSVDLTSPDALSKELSNDCGTTACAVGWAVAVLPDWAEVLELRDRGLGNNILLLRSTSQKLPRFFTANSSYKELADALGVQRGDAVSMFSPDHYVKKTPRIVADRIREFIMYQD